MESLDYVTDLTEKLEEQKIDFFVVTMRHSHKNCKTDVFFNIDDEGSFFALEQVLQKLNGHPEIIKVREENNDQQE